MWEKLRPWANGVMVAGTLACAGWVLNARTELVLLRSEVNDMKAWKIEAEKKMVDGATINAKIDGLDKRFTELSGLLNRVLDDRLNDR